VAGFIARRFLLMIPTVIGISIIVFLMVRLMPGDIIDVLFGADVIVSDEEKEQARRDLGISGSYAEQYWTWSSGVVTGDFGRSFRNAEPVLDVLLRALPITFELMILSLLIAVTIGIPLGVISAVRRDSTSDYASRVGGLIGISIPNFWLATLLLIFTSRVFGWVPPLGYTPFYEDPIENLSQFILPAISISVFTLAIVMRMVRATMLEVLSQDYIRTARAKGVRRRLVVYHHALRNALIPVVTVVGFEIGILMGGAAIVEVIFGLPGVGFVLLNAIFNRDFPVVQGATLLIAVIFVSANLLVDIVYGWLDPRISQH
jgi:peptide/nickel transport system permease protein